MTHAVGEPTHSLAWVLVPGTVGVTIALIILLGRPLGQLIFPRPDFSEFWRSALDDVAPKPAEQARYLLALVGAVLLPGALIWSDHRHWRMPRTTFTRATAVAAQLGFVVIAALGLLCKRNAIAFGISYFSAVTLIVSGALALCLCACLSSARATATAVSIMRERGRWMRWVGLLLAVAIVVIWLLPAIETDSTVASSNVGTWFDLQFTFDEGLSVVNGHTPLVNYVAQYGSLWPYLVAIPLHFGHGSLATYTTAMTVGSAFCLLAIYGVLRRVTTSTPSALLLFLAFIAMTCFVARGTPVFRYSFADYFGAFPMRYAVPYLTAWLLSRHLSGERPRRVGWIFLVSGLGVLNNGDFGVPALGATIIALAACAPRPWTRAAAVRSVSEACAGLVGAYALVAIVTVARTGQLPQLSLVFKYAHLFAVSGYQMVDMPWFGTWVPVYATFCAALVTATLLLLGRDRADVLTRTSAGLLAWAGIFGLGTGAYYAGRSLGEVLIELFSAWALAIVLLVTVVVRRQMREHRSPGVPEFALFVAFGLCLCSVAQFPAPWSSIRRLSTPSTFALFQPTAQVQFVRRWVRPGAPVALITYLGQRTSREAHVDDVTPFSGILSMPTKPQLAQTLTQLRRAGGHQVVLWVGSDDWPQLLPALKRDGFRSVSRSARSATFNYYVLLTDRPRSRRTGSATTSPAPAPHPAR